MSKRGKKGETSKEMMLWVLKLDILKNHRRRNNIGLNLFFDKGAILIFRSFSYASIPLFILRF